MSKEKVTEKLLQEQLFVALQTNDTDKDQKILAACEVIAVATVNLPQNPSPDKLNII